MTKQQLFGYQKLPCPLFPKRFNPLNTLVYLLSGTQKLTLPHKHLQKCIMQPLFHPILPSSLLLFPKIMDPRLQLPHQKRLQLSTMVTLPHCSLQDPIQLFPHADHKHPFYPQVCFSTIFPMTPFLVLLQQSHWLTPNISPLFLFILCLWHPLLPAFLISN